MGLVLRAGIATDQGPRDKNEDFVAVSWGRDFFALSDGIGGAPFGDVMSRIACNAAVRAYDQGASLGQAFRAANEAASSTSDLLGERSGATLLLAVRVGSRMSLAWAGDTIALMLRGCALLTVTRPGRRPGMGNSLEKAVGYGEVKPERADVDLRAGDRLLLCTDGVWEHMSHDRIARMLGEQGNMPLAAERIARAAGSCGQDNCTCVCLLVEEGDSPRVPEASRRPTWSSRTPVAPA